VGALATVKQSPVRKKRGGDDWSNCRAFYGGRSHKLWERGAIGQSHVLFTGGKTDFDELTEDSWIFSGEGA